MTNMMCWVGSRARAGKFHEDFLDWKREKTQTTPCLDIWVFLAPVVWRLDYIKTIQCSAYDNDFLTSTSASVY